MTSAPNIGHQRCVGSIFVLLHWALLPEQEVLVAPFDVRLSRFTVVEPDVLVARKRDLTEARLEGVPVLAIEVLSPSTHHIDLGTKRLTYEAAGVPAYWLVDPEVPGLTVLHLEQGRYVEHALATGDRPYEADFPVPVTVVPAQLIAG